MQKKIVVLCLVVCFAVVLSAVPVQALMTPYAAPVNDGVPYVCARIQQRIIRYTVTVNVSDGYSGSASATWVIPNCQLDMYISTDQNMWTFTWGGGWYIVVPLPAVFCRYASFWEVSDSSGYYERLPVGASNMTPGGTVYLNHTDANVWTSTHVHWAYTTTVYWIIVDLTVNIYTGQTTVPVGGGGGGAWKCYMV